MSLVRYVTPRTPGIRLRTTRGRSSPPLIGSVVAVPGAVAVDPRVVVPLQVVGMRALDQLHEAIEYPPVRVGMGETDLRGFGSAVIAAARRQPRFARERPAADGVEGDALG